MISKSDLKKPLKELSRLRGEQVSKYRAEEEKEKIDVLGQESERKALKWVQKAVAEAEKKESDQGQIDLSVLEKLKKHKIPYLRYLATIFLRFAAEEAIPKKYQINVDLTDKGLVIGIAGTNKYRAFTPCGLVSYDRNYCKIMAVMLGNTVAKMEGYYQRTKSGIIIPDEEDAKTYGTGPSN